jgi:peptide/nickel transport system substrate-binding protein
MLAESLTPSSDGRTLTVTLRPNVKFHDGSTLDAPAVAAALQNSLHSFMGPTYADIKSISAAGTKQVVIELKEPSLLLQEALEAPLQKAGTIPLGTGAFKAVPGSTTNIDSNTTYYLGAPVIHTLQVKTYPTVRAAWADLLRDQIDMLYEVGPEAIESMRGSTRASVFTFTRRYQHVIIFNPESKRLTSKIRQALSYAVDREAIVQHALRTFGEPSTGPIWPKHWAVRADLPRFTFNPKRAVDLLGSSTSGFQFTCLVAPDSIDEQIALEVKRQLAEIGVDMNVQGASREEIFRRASAGDYEAAAIERISGPTVFRPYLVWHTGGTFNFGRFHSATLDAALDRVKRAADEQAMRTAVAGMHEAFMDDPPALFIAWSVRARAVSNRFVIPPLEQDRDVLATLRLWRPAADNRNASRN